MAVGSYCCAGELRKQLEKAGAEDAALGLNLTVSKARRPGLFAKLGRRQRGTRLAGGSTAAGNWGRFCVSFSTALLKHAAGQRLELGSCAGSVPAQGAYLGSVLSPS